MPAGTPVSIPFLAQEFGLSPPTVKARLAALKPADAGNRGEPLYRISEAAAHLVQRQRVSEEDIAKAMKTLRPQDLPPMMQAVYWDAMRKRQAWERDAGMLWRTTDVLDVLTDLFRTIRETVRLWADEVDGERRMSSENLNYLRKRTDDLQAELHERFEKMKETGSTRSSVTEVEDADPAAMLALVEPDGAEASALLDEDDRPRKQRRRSIL